MKTKIHILQAFYGDCIVIETFDANDNPFNILIDGGPLETYKTTLVEELPKFVKIHLIVLSHIDEDHIDGLIEYLNSSFADDNDFDKIIINAKNLARIGTGTQVTYDKGVVLEKAISEKYNKIKIYTDLTNEKKYDLELPKGIDIKILSPNQKALNYLYEKWPYEQLQGEENTQISNETKPILAKEYNVSFEDLANLPDKKYSLKNDWINGSSIAFSIMTNDFSGLFLGDAHPKIVCDGMDEKLDNFPVYFDFVKLSHHGSKYNISKELLNKIKCKNFIVSTNGGKASAKHPDRETIAKIVKNNKDKKVNIIFNYPIEEVENWTGRLFAEYEYELFTYQHKNVLP